MADLTREHIDDVARRVGVRGHVHAAEIDSLCTMARLALDLQERVSDAVDERGDAVDAPFVARAHAATWKRLATILRLKANAHGKWVVKFAQGKHDWRARCCQAMRERDTARREREEVRAENERLRAEIKEYEAFEALLDEMRSAQ